jgi:glycosyltransferase involved in cell wall biosynthesis
LLKYGDSRFKFIRKLISGYFEFAQFLIPVGPKSELYHFAKKYLSENKVDAIIATGDPFILFSYASKLSKEFKTPWIADYRDTWVQDKTRSGNKFTKKWNAFFERKYLSNASTITTVSSFIIKQLQQNLPSHKYEILLNGFDPDSMNSAKKIKQGGNIFTISFAGTIYKWHPVRSVLSVFNQLLMDGIISEINIKFYGINFPNDVKKMIDNDFPKLINNVIIYPKMENEQLVLELAKSNVFLLFNDYSILGTKIFTYLGLKRKILLCYSNDFNSRILKNKYFNLSEFSTELKDLQANLIRETNSGVVIKDENELKKVIIELKKEFDSKSFVVCDSVGIEKYSRKKQTEKLAKLINFL